MPRTGRQWRTVRLADTVPHYTADDRPKAVAVIRRPSDRWLRRRDLCCQATFQDKLMRCLVVDRFVDSVDGRCHVWINYSEAPTSRNEPLPDLRRRPIAYLTWIWRRRPVAHWPGPGWSAPSPPPSDYFWTCHGHRRVGTAVCDRWFTRSVYERQISDENHRRSITPANFTAADGADADI